MLNHINLFLCDFYTKLLIQQQNEVKTKKCVNILYLCVCRASFSQFKVISINIVCFYNRILTRKFQSTQNQEVQFSRIVKKHLNDKIFFRKCISIFIKVIINYHVCIFKKLNMLSYRCQLIQNQEVIRKKLKCSKIARFSFFRHFQYFRTIVLQFKNCLKK